MSDPADYTVYQALDPGTDAVALHTMATCRPDLQQFVAANPSTPREVLDWLGRLRQPAIDAALQRRAPDGHQGATLPPPGPAPAAVQPPGPYAAVGHAPPAPYAAPPPGQQYPAPGRQPHPYAPPGGAYPAAARGGGRTAVIVAVIVVAALVIVGAVGIVVWRAVSSQDGPGPGQHHSGLLPGDTYGDNAELDEMWDDCEAGDGQACDDLFMNSEFDSDYEDFGNTCGNRFPIAGWCVDEM